MKLILFDFSGVFVNTADAGILQFLKKSLKKLSEKYIISIISSLSDNSIKKILAREEITPYFKDILGFETDTNKAIKIKMLLEKYKIFPKEAVYITDTVGDIMEARECGVKSIAVTWGFHDEETLHKAKPAKIISNPEDLIKAIEEI